jgi:choice-of-anchor C domain-containing protein
VSIINGSFETGTIDPGSFTTLGAGDSTSITGWTVGGAGVDYIGTYWTASDGARSLDLSALHSGSISQQLTGLHTGQQYTVSFDMAGNPDGGNDVKSLDVGVNGLATLNYTFDTTGQSKADMGWTTFTYVFVAAATTQTLTFLSQTDTPYGPALDNVAIAATPIPGAILLFGSALGGMGFLGYRRKKLEVAA